MGGRVVPREVTLRPKAPPVALLQAGVVVRQAVPLGDRHITLFEDKITVRDTTGESESLPRRYTLTHSDRTAEICLSVGVDYDQESLNHPQTRALRDEVLAEVTDGREPRLIVRCQIVSPAVSGKTADPAMRRRLFETEMPFLLAVIRYGDRFFYERHPELDQAPITVEFQATDPQFQARREYGRIAEYRVTRIAGESRRLMVGAAAVAAVGIGAFVFGRLRNRGD